MHALFWGSNGMTQALISKQRLGSFGDCQLRDGNRMLLASTFLAPRHSRIRRCDIKNEGCNYPTVYLSYDAI